MRRSLVLVRESLTDLTPADLESVAGAAPWTPWCHVFIEMGERIDGLLADPTTATTTTTR